MTHMVQSAIQIEGIEDNNLIFSQIYFTEQKHSYSQKIDFCWENEQQIFQPIV